LLARCCVCVLILQLWNSANPPHHLDRPHLPRAKLDTVSKAKYGTWIQELGGWTVLQDTLAVLKRVGRKHGGASSSLVAMRWVLQQRGVAALVVGARNAMHLSDMRRLYAFQLDEVDLLDIDAAYEGAAQPTTDVYQWERGGSW
jgi:diketogulonate reductase-like aldo/keto reductase